MSFALIATPEFRRSAKRLHRKYRLLYKDLALLQTELTRDPKAGVNLGGNCFKLCLPNSSIPAGKSGGFRVVYFLRTTQGEIYLLDIYTKTELENIREDRLLEILEANDLA